MRMFIKYIVLVIIISIVSYSLQVLWVKIVEPIILLYANGGLGFLAYMMNNSLKILIYRQPFLLV